MPTAPPDTQNVPLLAREPGLPPELKRLARFVQVVADQINSLMVQGILKQTGIVDWTLIAPHFADLLAYAARHGGSMIRLSHVRTLQIILGSPPAANELPVLVCYSDQAGFSYNGASQIATTTGSVAATICDSPPSGQTRDIDYVNVRNRDSAAVSVVIRINEGGTITEVKGCRLQSGDHLTFTTGEGWVVTDRNGAVKEADITGPGGTSSMPTLEIPSGTIDGVNDTFTLTVAPTLLMLFVNGVKVREGAGNDYTLSGNTITFTAGAIPKTGDSLEAFLFI